MIAVAACGGGGSSSGSGGGSSSSSSSSSASSVASYSAGAEITVASADILEGVVVTGLSNGNYLVTWGASGATSDEKDTEGSGVYYRIYAPSGKAAGAVRVANTTRANDQREPAASALKDGGFVIAWSDNGKINMQRFDNNGGKQGGQTQVSTTTTDDPGGARVIGLANGGYVISWTEFHPSGGVGPARTTIRSRIFTSGGVASGAEFQLADISNEGGAIHNDQLAPLTNGNFVFLLVTNAPRQGSAIVPNLTAQVYSASGTAQGAAYYVNDASNGGGGGYAAPMADGGYMAMWLRTSYGGDIRTRRVDASNAFTGAENAFAVDGEAIARARIAVLTSGGYVVAWHGYSNVSGQVFKADGSVFNTRFDAMTGGAMPEALALGSASGGSFAVSWTPGFSGQQYRNLGLRIYTPK
ncbi:hypothetical protein [Asticcacaulis sp.]|uniref:hypothetical protein n=1 Tax=Asticcacaulis sp. TaxID=1872648 RepID=UPI002C8A89F1|nr:hypothetical protein [Asticcacaulis sp.]HTM79754.1 hypothetical protein [Asticcacaulis sp.]